MEQLVGNQLAMDMRYSLSLSYTCNYGKSNDIYIYTFISNCHNILYLLYKVEFSFKLGWAYNRGPGCTASNVGQLVTNMNTSYWECTSGCGSTLNIANVNYICTGASVWENWEQGENTFTYNFPGIGPYTIK